jgi:hypothetical protein
MLINNETRCLHNDIIVKSVKCNEVISLLKSHSEANELHPTFVVVIASIAINIKWW